jgi:hypothetical protein
MVVSRSRNDCVVVALAAHCGLTYDAAATLVGHTPGSGVKLQLAQKVAIQLCGGEWTTHLTGDTGLLVVRRRGRLHMASVVGGLLLREDGVHIPVSHVLASWSVVRWLPVPYRKIPVENAETESVKRCA